MSSTVYAYAALLDVLGYRERLKRDRDNGHMSFQDALRRALSSLGEVNEARFQYRAISDTILIYCADQQGFPELAKLLQGLQRAFMAEGLLLRGGVAYGQHFHSGSITYSHALALAYELESKVAIYPRIVVDQNVIQVQRQIQVNVPEGLLAQHNGVYFIDIVGGGGWAEVYRMAKDIFDAEQDSIKSQESAFMKHAWLQSFILDHPRAESKDRYIETASIFQ